MSKLYINFIFLLFLLPTVQGQTDQLDTKGKIQQLVSNFSAEYPKATFSVYAFNKNTSYEAVYKGGAQEKTTNYNYEIGSVSKTFNSLLILNKVKDLDGFLNEEVGNYFPQFSSSVQKIKILQLLNHSSGLPPNFSALPLGKDPTQKLIDSKVEQWFQKKKIKKKGEFVYSNVGYALLGMVLEKKFGEDWSDLITNNILNNGMSNSYVYSKNKINANKLTGMNKKGKEVATWQFNTYDAAGAIVSNLDDLKVYLKMARVHYEKYTNESYWVPQGGRSNGGLSWISDKLSDEIIYVWHNGQTNGFSSDIGWIEKMDLGVIVLVNQAIDIDDFSKILLNAVIAYDNSTVEK